MPIRILMVDDEPYNLDILRIYFKSLKYEVYEAICGEDAIKMIEKVSPDLILLDVMLPDISGYDVCKKLNERSDFDTPIIFLSANTQKHAIIKGLELGVFDYLTKPFDLELLEKKVNVALQHRKNFKRKLNQLLQSDIEQARVSHTALYFMILQIDQLEMIYDSFGQDAGDFLIHSVTTRLKQSRIPINTFSRHGSDKLIATLPSTYDTKVVAEETVKIINSLSLKPYTVEQNEIFVTTSAGISVFPFDGENVQTLIKKADMAMHTAKRSGGNKFMFYSSDMDDSISKRMMMESRLRRSLERNELFLHYQPKIDIQTGKLVGTEALLRWNNQEIGMVSPAEFIPIAEETGLIHSIGRWVIETACEQNKKWNEAGFHELSIAVNISARQFEDPGFLEIIKEVLKKTGLRPDLLEVEITEGILMQNAQTATTLLHELKKLGVNISIDDFGTGYSSLSYLKKFPINCLKIDRTFIKDITSDNDNSIITKAIISLAHSLNLKVIAEGVENEEQVQFLKDHECEEV